MPSKVVPVVSMRTMRHVGMPRLVLAANAASFIHVGISYLEGMDQNRWEMLDVLFDDRVSDACSGTQAHTPTAAWLCSQCDHASRGCTVMCPLT